MFPNDQGSPSVGFQLAAKAREQLRPYFRVNGGLSMACGIFVGQLFYKKHFHLDHIHGVAVGNGYGPSGSLRAVFVLRSVDNIQPCTPTARK